MKRSAVLASVVLVSLTLASCDKSDAPERQVSTAGEILDGTISDEMLPYDTVRSEPLPAEPVEVQGEAGSAGSGTGDPGATAEAQEGSPSAEQERADTDAQAGEAATPDAE